MEIGSWSSTVVHAPDVDVTDVDVTGVDGLVQRGKGVVQVRQQGSHVPPLAGVGRDMAAGVTMCRLPRV